MNKYVVLSLCLTYLASSYSCQHPPLDDDFPGSGTVDTSGTGGVGGSMGMPCDPDTVYFNNDIFPIIRSNCAFAGCHGNGSAQDGVELSTYDNILSTADVVPFNANNSDLYEVITEDDPDDIMPPPPAATLSSAQINLIATWINQGAQNNSCDVCDTSSVSFSQTIGPIIASYCQGCHSGASPSAGIKLTNYTEIFEHVNTGRLIGSIRHESGFVPMPYNQPMLAECLVDQIEIWISEGAPNN